MLEELVRAGARQADSGEFTARAYFNGKLDLAQAEGIAATIASQNEAELRAAQQLLSGELARRLTPVLDSIAGTLASVEAGIDFSEEDILFIQADQVRARIDEVDRALGELAARSARFEGLSHEPQIVLVGRPNAGKSTLLNALAGQERAVVSDVAGTTRDALSAHVALRQGIVRLIDVAGIDERDSGNEIEHQMRERALRTLKSADVVVLVHDCTDSRARLKLPRPPNVVVVSKVDLQAPSVGGLEKCELRISARTGSGLDTLRDVLDKVAFGISSASANSLALNARHLQLIDDARQSLNRARVEIDAGPEILASELRQCLDSLGGILGQVTPDDVLGRVFAKFCIGK